MRLIGRPNHSCGFANRNRAHNPCVGSIERKCKASRYVAHSLMRTTCRTETNSETESFHTRFLRIFGQNREIFFSRLNFSAHKVCATKQQVRAMETQARASKTCVAELVRVQTHEIHSTRLGSLTTSPTNTISAVHATRESRTRRLPESCSARPFSRSASMASNESESVGIPHRRAFRASDVCRQVSP